MEYHANPCNTMQYQAMPCNTMQYHAIPCNTMQYHACLITADGAYHCPVGSIWPSLFSFFSFLTNFPFFSLSYQFSFYLSEKSSNNCTFYYRSGAEQLRWRLSNINRAFCPKVLYSLTLRRKLFCLKVLSFLLKRNLKQGFVFSNFEEKLLKHLTWSP